MAKAAKAERLDETDTPVGPDDEAAPPAPKRTPVKVMLARMADWAGGHESVPVGEGTPWDLERDENGIWFHSRIVGKKVSVWVPFSHVRSVECRVE